MSFDGALTLAYWLHMLATVVWIGGLATLVLLVLPLSRRYLPASDYANLIGQIHRRLDPLAWMSLVILVGTGLFQMSANPNYQGFITIANRWSAAILLKHLVFLGMVGVSAYLTWGVLPALQRLALKRVAGQDASTAGQWHRREVFLLRLNFALGIVVLGLTALARASQ
jgi:uncharacterized membrane protein